MNFFMHRKTWNFVEVDKNEALVYIYTNSQFLHQRPRSDPLCYYNDNIFSKDSSHDVEVLSDKENNNDDDNGDQGHGGGDVADASNR
jgi:hypothetical protein